VCGVNDDSAGLFAAVLERGGARRATDDVAWVAALLRVETALARAQSSLGLVPAASAAAIERVCADPRSVEPATLGAAAAAGGNPVIPLVQRLRARLPDDAAADLHRGATSQDVVDSAAMLVARDALGELLADLSGAVSSTVALVQDHRHTPTIGRTLLQPALPTTFGLKAAGWLRGLDGAAARLARVRGTLPVQLGGPVGALDGFGADALRLVEAFATELDLAPAAPWHTSRLPIADLAGALGTACGVVAKISGDLVLLAQHEVGEVREDVPGAGGSSSMAHKSNPIAAVSARAAARRGPALVGHLLSCMDQEHERAAGAWHAEWLPLRDLLRTTGSAAAWLDESLAHLVVDSDRMAANLGAEPAPSDPAAVDLLVDAALAGRTGGRAGAAEGTGRTS
jgi:3-carboxy-cis,cis-muconate cycloisomerase